MPGPGDGATEGRAANGGAGARATGEGAAAGAGVADTPVVTISIAESLQVLCWKSADTSKGARVGRVRGYARASEQRISGKRGLST